MLLSSVSRREVLSCCIGLGIGGSVSLFPKRDEILSLRERAQRKGLFYGAAVDLSNLADQAFVNALVAEAGIIVPSWEAKRNIIEPARGKYDFDKPDRIFDFARKANLAQRGHALVWHRANPSWLTAGLTPEGESILTGYVWDVVNRYKGRLSSWDVINEPIEPSHGRADGLRKNLWLNAFGENYIDLAFHTARAADPSALLVLNEYEIESDTPDQHRRREALLKLLGRLRSRKVPIDAVGIQSHLGAFGVPFKETPFDALLTEIKAMGLAVIVTELDVVDRGGPHSPSQRDAGVAELTKRVLDVALSHQNTLGVITWGLTDKSTWLADTEWGRWPDGQAPRVLPLDVRFKRKPMWHAIAAAIDGAPGRSDVHGAI